MSAAKDTAIRAYPELAGLATLRAGGWLFLPCHDEDGQLTSLDGFRRWRGCTDALRIRGQTDAVGIRVLGEGAGRGGGLVWERSGSVAEVVDALLALPAPEMRGAPALVTASAPRLWTPARSRTGLP